MDFLIVANWKMNGTREIVLEYKKNLENYLSSHSSLDIVICPPLPYLALFSSDNYKIGAQDVSNFVDGAHTGEVSAKMLGDIGCSYVIIGHSERRYCETAITLRTKIENAQAENLEVIYCVGETSEERDSGLYLKAIINQIDSVLPHNIAKITIAYEPIWAIGSGKVITDEQLGEVCREIFSYLELNYVNYDQNNFKFLYGGSVSSQNAKRFAKNPQINGLLIGSASLNYSELINIVEIIC